VRAERTILAFKPFALLFAGRAFDTARGFHPSSIDLIPAEPAGHFKYFGAEANPVG
jgi:hypothetical protein